jgi:hypothetical protein
VLVGHIPLRIYIPNNASKRNWDRAIDHAQKTQTRRFWSEDQHNRVALHAAQGGLFILGGQSYKNGRFIIQLTSIEWGRMADMTEQDIRDEGDEVSSTPLEFLKRNFTTLDLVDETAFVLLKQSLSVLKFKVVATVDFGFVQESLANGRIRR